MHPPDDARRIGLVSDSHSNLAAMRVAVRTLRSRGAQTIVHLGDICDSLQGEVLEESIRFVRQHGLLAVKGNNDFLLENLLRHMLPETRGAADEQMEFLRDLPMTIVWNDLCFAHSLPFDSLRAFYEPIDVGSTHRASEIFSSTPYRALFCGHSHSPVCFRWDRGEVTRFTIPDGAPIPIGPEERYIFVIGSVAEGECALFDRDAQKLERLRIEV
ncbi:MAG: metallophosphoesterase family protein [bacterium]